MREPKYVTAGNPAVTSEIVFLPREHKIHIFEQTCNVLFVIWRLNIEYFLLYVFQSSQVLQIWLAL